MSVDGHAHNLLCLSRRGRSPRLLEIRDEICVLQGCGIDLLPLHSLDQNGRDLDCALEVLDDGVGVGPGGGFPGGGHGLAGLAERVSALQGRVLAGPAPNGGYRLAVEVPVAALGGSES